jgi:magnesium-transporting ATPase (P-type)
MRRYIYNPELKRFIPGCWNAKTNIGTWLNKSYMYCGLTTHEADRRLGIVGPNVLDLKKPTLFGSIKNEFSKPFYLYQNFMVWTWGPFWYYFMAVVYALIGITGGMVVAIFQYGSDMDLYRLMVTEGTVEVVRDGGTVIKMDQTDVVPGDVIKLSPGIAFFDMCVLQAKHILVDESALTGEVHPISKIPLDPAHSTTLYNTRTHKTSTISAGTTILECGGGRGISDGDLAVVTETGSFTAKGELLCDVLSYQRHKFKFDTEVKLILAILVVEAIMMLALVFRVIEDNWVYSW